MSKKLKNCSKCKKILNKHTAYKTLDKRDGKYYFKCKSCSIQSYKNWYRKQKYNLTEREYSKLIKRKCNICNGTNRMCIDHCHKTNEVRGVLCTACNFGIGLFKNNWRILLKASNYIKEYDKTDRI